MAGDTSVSEHPPTSLEADIPPECRFCIISYLQTSELFGSYALVSRQCRKDSLCGSLPQIHWGEVFCNEKFVPFLHRMASPSFKAAFRHPRERLKVVGHSSLERPESSFQELECLAFAAQLPDFKTLDISIPKSVEGEHCLPRSVPWALSKMFQNLKMLDLSNVHGGPKEEGDLVSELAFFNHFNCPKLEIVRWNNRVGGCTFLRGHNMKTLEHLRELYIDGILVDFRYDGDFALETYNFLTSDSEERCIFFKCNKNLQKVSMLGAHFLEKTSEEPSAPLVFPFPQSALLKFVRSTPTLRWFRSDLLPSNVEKLQKERPGVVFLCA